MDAASESLDTTAHRQRGQSDIWEAQTDMYIVGSKVVHPCYGAGTVVRIQEKTISDERHQYYVISTVARAMQVMVPVRRASTVGLRDVGEAPKLRRMLAECGGAASAQEIKADLRARQADMREQLKSGRFAQVADVVRTLLLMNTRRPLGTIDRQLLDQGKELLASELALASDVAVEAAMEEVETNLNGSAPDK